LRLNYLRCGNTWAALISGREEDKFRRRQCSHVSFVGRLDGYAKKQHILILHLCILPIQAVIRSSCICCFETIYSSIAWQHLPLMNHSSAFFHWGAIFNMAVDLTKTKKAASRPFYNP
jgi:hypothetical protein